MFALSWRLALVVLATLPLSLAIMRFGAPPGHYRDRQRDLGRLNGLIEETVSGQRVIKSVAARPR